MAFIATVIGLDVLRMGEGRPQLSLGREDRGARPDLILLGFRLLNSNSASEEQSKDGYRR